MPEWLIAAFLLLVCAAAVVAVLLTERQNRFAVRQRVMVNLLDGKALSGVLWARRGGFLVLKDATLHERGADPTPVDGEVLVERRRVDFVQVL